MTSTAPSARDAAERSYINLWVGPLGLEAVAHAELSEAYDNISDEPRFYKYRGTLVETEPGKWTEVDLSVEAAEYSRKATEERFYWLRQTEAHGDKVA